MKKFFKIFGIIIGCLIVILVLSIGIQYVNYIPGMSYIDRYYDEMNPYIPELDDRPNIPSDIKDDKYFDLFVADAFFKGRTNQRYQGIPKEEVQIKWDIPVKQFWNNDTIIFSFKNTAREKLYYFGFKPPYYYIMIDYIITLQGYSDTLFFSTWGDFEAIGEAKYIPFKKNASITLIDSNPILRYPSSYSDFISTDTEEFPKLIKEVYGDTVQIRYSAFLRGLPWNNRSFSIAYSDFIKIPINSIIDGWVKGRFTNHGHYDLEEHKKYLNERDMMIKQYIR